VFGVYPYVVEHLWLVGRSVEEGYFLEDFQPSLNKVEE